MTQPIKIKTRNVSNKHKRRKRLTIFQQYLQHYGRFRMDKSMFRRLVKQFRSDNPNFSQAECMARAKRNRII